MGAEGWFFTIIGIVVVGLLAINYIVVTIRERRDGTPAGKGPADSIDFAAIQDPELVASIRSDRKIEAIKRYRELTGLGLKESKDVIDYVYDHPHLLDPPRSSR